MIDEKRIVQTIENAIVSSISKGEPFTIPYDSRINLAPQLHEAFKKIDYSKVIDRVAVLLEEELAQKLVNKIVTEMGTDIKKLMENASIREDFRFLMRKGVEEVLSKMK